MKSKYFLHIILLPFNEKASKEISAVLKAAVHNDTCGMVMNILLFVTLRMAISTVCLWRD